MQSSAHLLHHSAHCQMRRKGSKKTCMESEIREHNSATNGQMRALTLVLIVAIIVKGSKKLTVFETDF